MRERFHAECTGGCTRTPEAIEGSREACFFSVASMVPADPTARNHIGRLSGTVSLQPTVARTSSSVIPGAISRSRKPSPVGSNSP